MDELNLKLRVVLNEQEHQMLLKQAAEDRMWNEAFPKPKRMSLSELVQKFLQHGKDKLKTAKSQRIVKHPI